ncbi:hypothetical protein [Hydrogenophaga pseudoflava]|uniref:hypothetical protein n=1 Tax=Hydrogenophaga pseudoflava TaxID=47421 RepID=UPI0027E482AD|nr:hypothetical protein [Hydrogenophaga pseudoflava]MDQ7742863.1 hypothetical protein [Hydrogenophaga pseudoflava]
MHRWFVVLLIVLLPWRAWAGDAMVLSMTAGPDHTVEPVGSMEVVTPHCADHAVADLAAAALRRGAFCQRPVPPVAQAAHFLTSPTRGASARPPGAVYRFVKPGDSHDSNEARLAGLGADTAGS